MHPGFFHRLKGCRLGMGQSRLGATLGESPAPPAGLDQQELDALVSGAITHRCNLFAVFELAKLCGPKDLDGPLPGR